MIFAGARHSSGEIISASTKTRDLESCAASERGELEACGPEEHEEMAGSLLLVDLAGFHDELEVPRWVQQHAEVG